MKKVLSLILLVSLLTINISALAMSETTFENEFYYKREGDGFVITGLVMGEDRLVVKGDKNGEVRLLNASTLNVPGNINGAWVKLEKEAFRGKNAFSKIVFEEGITNIPDYLCADMPNLEEVVLPDSLVEIGKGAFYGSSIKKITFSENVERICNQAFRNCEKLEEIILPDSVNYIGVGAFDGCISLKKVNLPKNVKTIESHTFFNCVSLTQMEFPEKVKLIKDSAFGLCESLEVVKFYNPDTEIFQGGIDSSVKRGDPYLYPSFTGSNIKVVYCYKNSKVEANFDDRHEFIYLDNNNEVDASEWAIDGINKAFEMGIVTDSLKENWKKAITREEFCEALVKSLAHYLDYDIDAFFEYVKGVEYTNNEISFADCDNRFVILAAGMGIVNGKGEGMFSPTDEITREEAAAMLFRARYACSKTMMYSNLDYEDKDLISPWATKAVEHMRASGIMRGVSETRFAPKDTYTHEMAMVTFSRLFDYTQEGKTVNNTEFYVSGAKYTERPTYEKSMAYYTENYTVKERFETAYGTILDLYRGERHGSSIPLMFIMKDGKTVCINAEAPWASWYYQSHHQSIKIYEKEKTAVVTYATIKEPRPFHPGGGSDEKITGTFVFTLNLETGEVTKELKPLNSIDKTAEYIKTLYKYNTVIDENGGEHIELYEYLGSEEVVNIPEKIDKKTVGAIATGCFTLCDTIKKVVIPESVKVIYHEAFSQCKNLGEVVILNPEAVIIKETEDSIFMGEGLEGMSLPGHKGAFFGCPIEKAYGYKNSSAEKFFGEAFIPLDK